MNRENQKKTLEVKDDKITEGQENFEPTQTFIIIQKWETRKENRIRYIFSTFSGLKFKIMVYCIIMGFLKSLYYSTKQISSQFILLTG